MFAELDDIFEEESDDEKFICFENSYEKIVKSQNTIRLPLSLAKLIWIWRQICKVATAIKRQQK